MAKKKINSITYDVIELLKTGKKTPEEFLTSKEKLKKQGVDVAFVEQGLVRRKLLPSAPHLGPKEIVKAQKAHKKYKDFMRGLEGRITSEDVKPDPGQAIKLTPAHFGYALGTGADLAMVSPKAVGIESQILDKLAPLFKQPSPIKAKIARGFAKTLSLTTGIPEEKIFKAMSNPGKYLKKPLTVAEETAEMGKVKNVAVANLDDLFSFRVKTLEDDIAKAASKYENTKISVEPIESAIKNYLDDMIHRGIIDEYPKPVNRLLENLRAKSRPINPEIPDMGRYLSFEDAHQIKRDIYKTIKDAYGAESFTDITANAFKIGAKTDNELMATAYPAYGEANKKLKAIYDIYEDLGPNGIQTFSGRGASKRFRAFFKDDEGKQILQGLEDILPENKKFMKGLLDLEDMQDIRKTFRQTKAESPLAGPIIGGSTAIGGAVGSVGGIGGAGIGGLAGLTLGTGIATPRGLGSTIAATSALSEKVAPPALGLLNVLGRRPTTTGALLNR